MEYIDVCINPMISNCMQSLLTCFVSQGCQGGEQDSLGRGSSFRDH